MLKYLNFILIFLMVVFLLPANLAFAYKLDTHEYLTREAADFFNDYYSDLEIDENLINQMVAGTMDEDDLSRPVYHFYDPINNRGLKIGFSEWLSAKDWSTNSGAQLALKPLFSLASIFGVNNETDFTWDRAIDYYRDSDKEKAFYVLGHVMHLIQDMAVPDHTRNDQHITGSAYENFSDQKQLDLVREQPIILNSLNDYFDQLSSYSNKNFYSQDTIGLVGYKSPQPDYQAYKDGFYYGIKTDELGEYYLSRKSGSSLLFANIFNVTVDDPLVLNGYWKRLASKAVQYSASLIKFFINEAEKEENEQISFNNSDLQEQPFTMKQISDSKEDQNQIHQITERANNLLDEIEAVIEKVGKGTVVTVPSYVKPAQPNAPVISYTSASNIQDVLEVTSSPDSSTGGSSGSIGGENELPTQPSKVNVVIGEFLFDAEGTDAGKEFIRLCNLGSETVSLEGWSIQTSGKKKNFETGNQITVNGGFLIWFGENSDADMEWKSGSLRNATDTIYLVSKTDIVLGDDDAAIIDKVSYDVAQISGFESGQVITKHSCGVGGVSIDNEVEDAPENWNISDIYFYEDSSNPGVNLVDIYFVSYPLISGRTDAWKALLFYKDREPLAVENDYLETSGDWLPKDTDNLLAISYPNYAGEINRRSLILPDIPERYGNQGGLQNFAFNYEVIDRDKMIRLKTTDQAEYLTVAVYDFYQSGGGNQSFKLNIASKRKFFWQEGIIN